MLHVKITTKMPCSYYVQDGRAVTVHQTMCSTTGSPAHFLVTCPTDPCVHLDDGHTSGWTSVSEHLRRNGAKGVFHSCSLVVYWRAVTLPFILPTRNQWPTKSGGGGWGGGGSLEGSNPPPPEIPKALQNRAKLNPIVKTVEFRTPNPQDIRKKVVKF